MRITVASAAVAAIAAALALPASGAEGVLHMRCAWKKVTDMKTLQTKPQPGGTDFYYSPASDLTGTMTKDGFDHPFVAGIRDRLIEGVAHYQAEGVAAEQRVEINRYTGAIKNLVMTATSTEVLEGTCTRISGPDFGQQGEGQ